MHPGGPLSTPLPLLGGTPQHPTGDGDVVASPGPEVAPIDPPCLTGPSRLQGGPHQHPEVGVRRSGWCPMVVGHPRVMGMGMGGDTPTRHRPAPRCARRTPPHPKKPSPSPRPVWSCGWGATLGGGGVGVEEGTQASGDTHHPPKKKKQGPPPPQKTPRDSGDRELPSPPPQNPQRTPPPNPKGTRACGDPHCPTPQIPGDPPHRPKPPGDPPQKNTQGPRHPGIPPPSKHPGDPAQTPRGPPPPPKTPRGPPSSQSQGTQVTGDPHHTPPQNPRGPPPNPQGTMASGGTPPSQVRPPHLRRAR